MAALTVRHRPAPRPPVWCFAGGGAPALSLLPLARGLPADRTVHGVQAAGFEGRAWPGSSADGAARRHLREIRRTMPAGPYPLVGHSFGGLLALIVARRLVAAGERVPFVVLLDTRLPPSLGTGSGPRAARAHREPARTAPEPTTGDAAGGMPSLRERLTMHRRVATAGLLRFPPAVRDQVFWERSLRMTNRHRPAPYSGRVVLVQAQDNTDDVDRWRTVLTGPFEVHRVPGGHSSILRAPFNAPVLALLRAELDRAELDRAR